MPRRRPSGGEVATAGLARPRGEPVYAPDPTLRRWVGLSLAAAIAWAIWMYSRQYTDGLGVTGLNKPVFWGLYIANFIFCVGLSAGGIAVSALVHLLDRKDMKPVAIMAEVLATSFL